MTPTSPSSSGGGSWATRYEELRRQVLSGDSRGPGLTVLLSRGMKAWFEVAGSLDMRPAPLPPETAADAGPLRTLPAEWRAQLTAVLTGMVLHGAQQGRHT